MILALVPRRIDRHWELGDVALELGDLARALLVDLVYANDRVNGQVSPLDVFELGFDLLLGRIDDEGRPLAEHEFLDFDEAKQLAMTYRAGIDLVNLPLAHENDFE